jgi:hypothetical protein
MSAKRKPSLTLELWWPPSVQGWSGGVKPLWSISGPLIGFRVPLEECKIFGKAVPQRRLTGEGYLRVAIAARWENTSLIPKGDPGST